MALGGRRDLSTVLVGLSMVFAVGATACSSGSTATGPGRSASPEALSPSISPTPGSPTAPITPRPSPLTLPPLRELIRGSVPVRFRSTDGVRLSGRLFGHGTHGVVLGHIGGGDQTGWWPVAILLARRGYLVLTFDFRGFCPGGLAGCSGGEQDFSRSWLDLLGGVGFIRIEGARSVWVGGGSIGADASLYVAERRPEKVDGELWVSGTELGSGYLFERDDVRRILVPKLFVAARDDGLAPDSPQAARDLFRWAIEPKRLVMLPTSEHGTDIVRYAPAPVARHMERAIVGFLARYDPIGRNA